MASIWLEESNQPMYFQTRKVPVCIIVLLLAKLKKILEQKILEKVKQGGRNWASPIVAIRKLNGDLRICGDYKVNNQICFDAFPLPNIETACHEFLV